MNFSTACYRVHNKSISNSTDYQKTLRFYNTIHDIQLFFVKKFKVDDAISKIIEYNYNVGLLALNIKFKNYLEVKRISRSINMKNIKSAILKLVSKSRIFINLFAFFR